MFNTLLVVFFAPAVLLLGIVFGIALACIAINWLDKR